MKKSGIDRKLIRPVICPVCKRAMFYASDPNHEPELMINVVSSRLDNAQNIYIHESCWNRVGSVY